MLAVAAQLPALELEPDASAGAPKASNAQMAEATDLMLNDEVLPWLDEPGENMREMRERPAPPLQNP
jgi:hypothetical protein